MSSIYVFTHALYIVWDLQNGRIILSRDIFLSIKVEMSRPQTCYHGRSLDSLFQQTISKLHVLIHILYIVWDLQQLTKLLYCDRFPLFDTVQMNQTQACY